MRIKKIALLFDIILIAFSFFLFAGCESQKRKQSFAIQIEITQVSYIQANCLGLGPKIIHKEECPELVAELIDMLNGEYSYYDTWDIPEVSGGGPYSISFFDDENKEILKLRFYKDLLYVTHTETKSYDRYTHDKSTLDFTSFFKIVYGFEE